MGDPWEDALSQWRDARTALEAADAAQDLADVICETGSVLYPETLTVIEELQTDPGQHRWAAILWDFLAYVADHAYYFTDSDLPETTYRDAMLHGEQAYQQALAELLPRAWKDVGDHDPEVRALSAQFIASVRHQRPAPIDGLRQAYSDEPDERVRAWLARALYHYCNSSEKPRPGDPSCDAVLRWLEAELTCASSFLVDRFSVYWDDPRWSPHTARVLKDAREARRKVFRWPAQQF